MTIESPQSNLNTNVIKINTLNPFVIDNPEIFTVIKRNGEKVPFNINKIFVAIAKAFIEVEGTALIGTNDLNEKVKKVTDKVHKKIINNRHMTGYLNIENIQDLVETTLMEDGYHLVSKAYILYREKKNQERKMVQENTIVVNGFHLNKPSLKIKNKEGLLTSFNAEKYFKLILEACSGYKETDPLFLYNSSINEMFDEIDEVLIYDPLILTARARIEVEPSYGKVATKFLNFKLRNECLNFLFGNNEDYDLSTNHLNKNEVKFKILQQTIEKGIELGQLDQRLKDNFDLKNLSSWMDFNKDEQFDYLGFSTLYDRYFIHSDGVRYELPQVFFMRVAMGIALAEKDLDDLNYWAIQFYKTMSSFDYMPSTPTLFNAGGNRAQLSSCFVSQIPDDLHGIYTGIRDNAMLSKFAGGIGNDWTPVRGIGAKIKGTNGKSSGTIPFLKVANDTAVAVNQGGKRKGAVCAYLETWHRDIEEFLELRKNVGDDRRRTHDMDTANWVPDLFMERVIAEGDWTLFSPEEVPELHDLFGKEFAEKYCYYENQAEQGNIKNYKKIKAVTLWRKMLGMLFETGHPWITFKDAFNLRNPQQHVGVIHSSNLCVAPETLVLTDKGHLPIKDLVDQTINVWNGNEYSETKVFKTSNDSPLIKVKLSNGGELDCTHQHKFHVIKNYSGATEIVDASQLIVGMKLIKSDSFPIIDNSLIDWSEAYANGFYSADGCENNSGKYPIIYLYGKKKELLPVISESLNNDFVIKNDFNCDRIMVYVQKEKLNKKFFVPFNYSLESKLKWLAGVCDGDGTVCKNGLTQSIQIANVNKEFLNNIRLMLQTLGVDSKVTLTRNEGFHLLPDGQGSTKDYYCNSLYRLLIGEHGVQTLLSLGFITMRLNLIVRSYNREATQYTTVESVTDYGRRDETYCFTEPKRHLGVFNGILTGQCTEIALNNKAGDEIAVCNLGSINLVNHISSDLIKDKNTYGIDYHKLKETINVAMRMLDNVIDVNYYTVSAAETSNKRHRPVGLGIMGYQDCLYKLNIPFDSQDNIQFASELQELISFLALSSNVELSTVRGAYPSFDGSLWSQGILPIDSYQYMMSNRNYKNNVDIKFNLTIPQYDWEKLREDIKEFGLRNSNMMAVAPTATIANIIGVSQSIEPQYSNLYVKSNMGGDYTVINEYLVNKLKDLDIWDTVMLHDLKLHDGSIQNIDRIPDSIKRLFKITWEIDPKYLIDTGAVRQLWMDQSQSLNIYMSAPSGKKLNDIYIRAWEVGLKSTYYLRTLGATHAEKTTITDTRLNKVPESSQASESKMCRIDDPTCESCQ